MLHKDGKTMIVDASDETWFSRLVADGWRVTEEPVAVGPGSLFGHATSVASKRKDINAT